MNPIAAADLARQQHSEQHRAVRDARLAKALKARRQARKADARARSAATRAEQAGEFAVLADAR